MGKRGPKKGTGGAPLTFTDEIWQGIREHLERGMSLRGACGKEGVALSTFYKWLHNPKIKNLVEQYARARAEREDLYLSKALDGIDSKDTDGGLALEMLSRVEPQWRKRNKLDLNVNFSELTDEQLERLAAGDDMDLESVLGG